MKNNIEMHFKGYEDFIARINDYLFQAYKMGVVYTPFLTPHEIDIASRFIGKKAIISFDGGYQNSEYKRAKISYDEYDDDFKISILKAKFNTNYNKISHRDVLGALLNLGIERNQFGDILIIDNYIYIFVIEEIDTYIMSSLTKIARCKVTFTRCYDEVEYEAAIEYKQYIISSFRLDNIVGSIAHLSREKSKRLITSNLVKVNYEILEDTSFICNNNCIISIRGYGRFILKDLEKSTKNNNHIILIGKYV